MQSSRCELLLHIQCCLSVCWSRPRSPIQKRLDLDRFCLGLAQRTRYYVETRIPQEKEQF